MNNIRIAVTLLNTLRPVGPVSERDQTLLNDTLVRELGPNYANFLAEPVPSGDGTRIDWYVDAKNRPRALEDLNAEQQVALFELAENRKKNVIALADRLEAGSRNDKEVAQALRNAMMTPETGWLYNVDNKPVIVGWGYVSATEEKRDMSLKAVGTAGTTKPAIPEQSITTAAPNDTTPQEEPEPQIEKQPLAETPAEPEKTSSSTGHHIHYKTYITHEEIGPKRSTPWFFILLWALFAVLLLILLWLIFATPALQRWGGLFGSQNTIVEQGNGASLQRIDALNREIGNLENDLRQRQAQCNVVHQAQNQPPAAPREQAQREQTPSAPAQPVIVAPTIVINPNDNQQPEQHAERTPEPIQPVTPQTETPQAETPREEANPPQSERQRDLDERIKRSGAQSGVLQITLTWDGKADLDLSIMCPNNTRVFFKRPRGCGARLDRDANRHPARLSREPIENIFFSDPGSIPAKIPVYVDYYDNHGDPRRNTPFRIRIRKTTIDPATGQQKVEDKIIDGVADGSRRRSPRRVYTITNP